MATVGADNEPMRSAHKQLMIAAGQAVTLGGARLVMALAELCAACGRVRRRIEHQGSRTRCLRAP